MTAPVSTRAIRTRKAAQPGALETVIHLFKSLSFIFATGVWSKFVSFPSLTSCFQKTSICFKVFLEREKPFCLIWSRKQLNAEPCAHFPTRGPVPRAGFPSRHRAHSLRSRRSGQPSTSPACRRPPSAVGRGCTEAACVLPGAPGFPQGPCQRGGRASPCCRAAGIGAFGSCLKGSA